MTIMTSRNILVLIVSISILVLHIFPIGFQDNRGGLFLSTVV